jgi:hemerythrin superfamily protein
MSANAIELLKQDHREVESQFGEYEEAESNEERAELSAKICLALTVHAQIEEEIFYPRAREAIEDSELLDEAVAEHAGAKRLIAEIQSMEVGDELYDEKVTELAQQIEHHVKEEEEELFPEVENSKMDLEAVGRKLAERKRELTSQLEGSAAGRARAR